MEYIYNKNISIGIGKYFIKFRLDKTKYVILILYFIFRITHDDKFLPHFQNYNIISAVNFRCLMDSNNFRAYLLINLLMKIDSFFLTQKKVSKQQVPIRTNRSVLGLDFGLLEGCEIEVFKIYFLNLILGFYKISLFEKKDISYVI